MSCKKYLYQFESIDYCLRFHYFLSMYMFYLVLEINPSKKFRSLEVRRKYIALKNEKKKLRFRIQYQWLTSDEPVIQQKNHIFVVTQCKFLL